MKRFILAVCLTWAGILSAQNPFFINYTVTDGLPSSNVYSVMQDEYGYIWFTTDVGVAKYDGHHFEKFNMDNGLSDNEVFKIKRDYKGRYWLMTLNGKTCYFQKGKLYNENNSALVKKIASKSYMNDFYIDHNKNIYFQYLRGDAFQVDENDKVTKINNKYKEVGRDGIWERGSKKYFLNGKGVYGYWDYKMIWPLNFNRGYTMKVYHTNLGDYFSYCNELYKIGVDGKPRLVVKVSESVVEILNVLPESNNKTWICTRKGIYLFENGALQKSYFKDDSITSMIKDSEDGYWLSTLNRGALYIPSFDVFNLTDYLKVDCIGVNNKKEVWFGDDYNHYYILKNGAITKYSIFQNRLATKISRIRFFNGATYIAAKAGSMRIDSQGKVTKNLSYADDIYESEKYIYFGSSCVARIKKENFGKDIGLDKMVLFRRASALSGGGNGDVWLGTGFGLYRYNPKDSITDFSTKDKALEASIKDLLFDKSTNTLYVASIDKGIVAFKDEIIVNHFTMRDGLNSNSCNIIKKISADLFLIGSNNGLNSMELNGSTVKIKNLNPFIGMKDNKINDIGFLGNTIYLATDKGLLSFDRNRIISRKITPKCLIVNLKNQDKIINKEFSFPYTENDISIEFNGISFINRGELVYYYRLNKSSKWKSSKETQVNFSTLASGKYKFEVYCVDQLGNKSNTSSISFEILTPFWQKIWFILLMFILFIVVLYLFIQFWLKRQRLRFEKEKAIIQIERDKANLEKQMIELEQKALRLQMNPHFIFNALNTIKGYYSEGDTLNASSYISKFSKLLRMLLENTEQLIPLSKEIEMLELYVHLNKIRYKDKFDYKLIVDNNLNTDDIAIPTLLLQPMVENAIIHGLSPKNEKGTLTVSFLKKDAYLECTVEDNGVGRTASKTSSLKEDDHQSMALEITKERLELFNNGNINSTIEIIDLKDKEVALGTKVIIRIPLTSIW